MNLPTQAQINAATRHAASFAAGAIAMFGLSTKLDPNTVQQIINATGTLVNDAILLAGLISPFITAWYASKSATPKAQADAITKAVPGTVVVTPDKTLAAVTGPNVLSTDEVKVIKNPSAS